MPKLEDDNSIVAPGDTVYTGKEINPGNGVYEDNGKIKSKHIGSVDYRNGYVNVVPMSGRYIPEEGDVIIAEVKSIGYSNWRADLNSPYDGMLKIDEAVDEYIDLDEDDLRDYYEVGDAIVVKVSSVTEGMDVNLSMMDKRCKKLRGGRIIEVSPSKVPRVIGKKGTMVKQIKKETDTDIIVGQNGRVWIQGENPNLAVRAVKKVEKEAHIDGLTDRIAEFLKEEKGDNQ